jgi:PAS domain S-box-containing protein
MKIRDRLLLTFIIIIFLFGITGYLEHRYIAKVTSSFQQLDKQISPSLTSLLELITSIRRASIKAMEFSLRGRPEDREKTEEAAAQIDHQFKTFLSLHQHQKKQFELDELVDIKNRYIQVINDYLQMTKGPAIEQVLGKQEELRKAHDDLITHINEALAQTSGPVKNNLELIKSATQQASVQLMEFILLGKSEDLVRAQQAMNELEDARNALISGSSTTPGMIKVVASQTQNYDTLIRDYVREMASYHHTLEDITRKEEELHATRKALIHTLYPIIEHHYAALAQATNTTAEKLAQADRLKIYSILFVSIIALVAALLLSYTISSPLNRLSSLVARFGKGEKINTEEVNSIDGSQELGHLSHSVAAMMRERDSLYSSIQENGRFVRLLLDSSPVGLALARMDGTLVDINPAFAAIAGRSVEDTLGMNLRDITHEDYFDREQIRLDSLKTTGSYGPYEKEYLHRDGHSVPVRLSGRLIERDGEQLIWSVVEDISLQKQAAEQNELQLQILRQTEKRLDEAQRVAHIGTWELDIVENRLWWSDEIFNIFEIDPANFDGTDESFFAVVHPDDREQVKSAYSEAIANHLPYQITHRVLLRDGRIKYVHDRGETEYDEDGRPLRSIGTVQDVTENKLASEAIRKSEERYTLAARIGRSGAWEMWPRDGKIFFDENLPRLLGYEKGELSEDLADWVDTVPESARDKVQTAMQAVLDGHSDHYTIEHPVVRKDGSIGWVYIQGQVVSQPDEKPLRLVGSSVDITERRQAEEALRLTQFSLDHAPEGVFWMQEDGTVSYVNIEGCRSLGYSQEELIGLHVWDFDPDFSPERWPEQWKKMRQAGHHTFETSHRSKDGKSHPVEISVVRTSYGGMEHHSAFVRDITERKRAEEALRQLNEELEDRVAQRTATVRLQAQIIDQTHDSVITTDLDGYVTSWNGGAEQLFGVQADDAIGQYISFIYPEKEHEFLQNRIIEPLNAKGQHETEVIMMRADGSEFPAHLSLSLLYDSEGKPQGMVGYSIDISELKKREQELGELARRLQASNRELEAFSYSVSHDLRAPLRAIDGFSLALVEDYGNQLDATARDYLQRVRNSAQRMGMLIDDMLQLSRVNREELAIEEVDLGEIALEVMEELRSAEPERHVELTLGQDLRVQGDPRLMRVMMDNLLGNAWKFTGRKTDAHIIFQQKPDQQGIFYISDNGAGFDMRHKDKLFGAFQRLHRVKDFPGTGVGLATVQRIVHRHGGRVWAEAREGKGATFYFSLGPGVKP